MIKGVAFDFDCTLYRRERVWDRLVEGFLVRFGPYITPSLSAADVLHILRQGDAEGIANDENWQGIFARYIRKGLFHTAPAFEAFFAFIEQEFPPAIVLHSDALECLRELKRRGLKTAIYTNGLSDYGRLKIRSTGIDRYIDYILCSEDIGIEKPDPRGFAVLAGGMGLKAEEIVFIGDHPKNDVLGSKNAGMTAVWIKALVDWPDHTARPAYTVQALSQLLTVIDAVNSAQMQGDFI